MSTAVIGKQHLRLALAKGGAPRGHEVTFSWSATPVYY